jgi:lysophospholipase L1-like esterase
VTTEYPKQASNVKVFDLFNALAIAEGKPDQNTLAPQFATARDDSHPSREGARAMTRLFIPWLNRALREAGVVGRGGQRESARSETAEGERGAVGGRAR